jgi:hypothetical protein
MHLPFLLPSFALGFDSHLFIDPELSIYKLSAIATLLQEAIVAEGCYYKGLSSLLQRIIVVEGRHCEGLSLLQRVIVIAKNHHCRGSLLQRVVVVAKGCCGEYGNMVNAGRC